MKEQIHTFIHSPEFAETVDQAIDNRLELFLDQDVDTILSGNNRDNIYHFLGKKYFENVGKRGDGTMG